MSVKLLTEHNLECLSLNGGCLGSSESKLVKMPHCLKSHVTAHIFVDLQEKEESVFTCGLLLFCQHYVCHLSLVSSYPSKVKPVLSGHSKVDKTKF